jgi:hypothetical protein
MINSLLSLLYICNEKGARKKSKVKLNGDGFPVILI